MALVETPVLNTQVSSDESFAERKNGSCNNESCELPSQ